MLILILAFQKIMNMNKSVSSLSVILGLILSLGACKKSNNDATPSPKNPNTAPAASIDRFSAAAGHLQVRTASNGLPAPNQPVNFDKGPFITQGLSPTGGVIWYYNFDIQPVTPAPIYVFVTGAQNTPVQGQNNVVDVVPGNAGYNDFWQINMVTVPNNYVANTVTSYQEIMANGYTITPTDQLVNCPVVPQGSTASMRLPAGSSTALELGWYKDSVIYYFNFAERSITTNSMGQVPVIPIYVSFNINPNLPNGGPASGFKTAPGTIQTHNVVTALPSDAFYTPLWAVAVFDSNSFDSVTNETSAMAAPLLVPNAGTVNCPVVGIQ
jgi:hypothetical protein